MQKDYHIAIVGATGAVGVELLRVLERRAFPVKRLRPLASARSAGRDVSVSRAKRSRSRNCAQIRSTEIDLAFFSAGGDISRKYAPIARDGRRGRDRQFLRLPHGTRTCRSSFRRSTAHDVRQHRGIDRESELHHCGGADGALSAAPRVRGAARFRRELPGCFRQRRARDRRIASARSKRPPTATPLVAGGLSASDRLQRAAARRFVSARTATPRKK